jgi:hypothetical protein
MRNGGPAAPCTTSPPPSPDPSQGHAADLLLVHGNPLEDISVLTHPEARLKMIIKGGQVVKGGSSGA